MTPPFYTDRYDYENNFNLDVEMVVFDLSNNLFTKDGVNWIQIEFDHL